MHPTIGRGSQTGLIYDKLIVVQIKKEGSSKVSSIDGIPSYVLQNIASIQDNINSIMADAARIGGARVKFDNFLEDALGNISTTFSDDFDSFDNIRIIGNPYQTTSPAMPGVSGNQGAAPDINEIINNQNNKNVSNAESTEVVKKAYDSLLNGQMANLLAPNAAASTDNNSLIERLKKLNSVGSLDKNTSLVTDEEFFDAESLTPTQITEILKKKGSPYAYQTYEGGRTIGQLIYDECHRAGTAEQGPHTVNPALIISIMGAESGFGTDPKAVKNNPFNVRLNGSFHNVPNLETSVNMAVNTMYNWAISRPKDSKVSFLDYAGDKYCENYLEKWKPNVEKYFLEFSIANQKPEIVNSISGNELDQKQKMASQILSSINPGLSNKGLNIDSLLKMSGDNNIENNSPAGAPVFGNTENNIISAMSTLSAFNPSSGLEDSEDN